MRRCHDCEMADIDVEALIDRYCHILAPLFERSGDPFDYVLALLRATGFEGAGWDTLPESFRMLDDLQLLTMAELPTEHFREPKHTGLRLSLLEYCHLVEMDAPYDIIANLCRVRLGMPASHCPFATEAKVKPQNAGVKKSRKPAKRLGPADKISQIISLTNRAGIPAIGAAFNDFYRAGIRNAISHSDYILYNEEFRMRSQSIPADDGARSRTSIVKFDRLHELISYARAFYLAFIRVEKGARLALGAYKGRSLKYDERYKGILEILADDVGFLCGAIIHWPNGSESSYIRTANGSKPMNILPIDAILEPTVGEVYSPHDQFSPLLKPGQLPSYTPLNASNEPLHWHEE